MTDKEIIIHNIDVSGCRHYEPTTFYDCNETATEDGGIRCQDCSDNPDCSYKQLKRKEQECKLLKATLKDKNFVAVMEENEKLKQECVELKKYKDVVNKLAGLQIILTNKDKMPELYENAKDLKIDSYKQALEKIEKIALRYVEAQGRCEILEIINEVKG